jgi:DNA-binding MarR family transcriptional regulator
MQITITCYSACMAAHRSTARPADAGAATDAVLVASRALVGIAARSLAAVEDTVTLVQYRALVLLASRGEMNVGNLAQELGLHQSTATRLCDRLVNKGLVDRNHSAESRREVFIGLTVDGQALVRAVSTRRRTEISKIAGRITPARRAQLIDAFAEFADAAGELPDDAWKLGWTT